MQKLTRAIPSYVLVAMSAWGSRAVVAFVSLATVRVLLKSLGTEQYSVFAILGGLTSWFMLFDLGTGFSAQNYISERRANRQQYSDLIAAGVVLSAGFLAIAAALVLIAGPVAAKFLFRQYHILSSAQKRDLFLVVALLSVLGALSGFVNRVWYARQRGFLANIAPAIGPVIAFGLIKLISVTAITNKLYWSSVAFFAPPALLTAAAACTLFVHIPKQSFATVWNDIKLILRRGRGHWLFALLATATLKVDYIVMSQLLSGDDIVSYNIASMLFTSIFFIYAAVLTALWPNCAEAIAQNRWNVIGSYLRRYITLGIALVVLSSFCIAVFRPQILHLLSPTAPVSLSLSLICLFGFYFVIRVWTDIFAMILQSMSAMKIFLIAVPIEAAIAVPLQIIFVRYIGALGVPAALIVAYLCTVSWIMPLALHQTHRAAIGS
jgi:O-antigen/teichoic acid export membrane protein